MDLLIFEPNIPYKELVSRNFKLGKGVTIHGKILLGASGFTVVFTRETENEKDVALKIAFDVENSNATVFHGEKKDVIKDVPFKATRKFKITIECNTANYEILFNDQKYGEYLQHFPCNRVTHISIEGHISVQQISYGTSTLNHVTIHDDPPPSYSESQAKMCNGAYGSFEVSPALIVANQPRNFSYQQPNNVHHESYVPVFQQGSLISMHDISSHRRAILARRKKIAVWICVTLFMMAIFISVVFGGNAGRHHREHHHEHNS